MKSLARNALLAAVYVILTIWTPAGAFLNIRWTTALYAVFPGAWVGLGVGNALGNYPQGPVDMLGGLIVGWLTAYLCGQVPRWWRPALVLVVPTLVVPLWLQLLFHVPYLAVVGSLAIGQSLAALVAWVLIALGVDRKLASL